MMEQQPRAIVITGAAAGIGRATALLCAERGDRVALLDKDDGEAEAAAVEALSRGATDAVAIQCDVADESQVSEAFATVQAQFGVPWGIFANAGIDLGRPLHELSLDQWQRVIDTNLTGVFLTCKHALRLMVEARAGGSIVCASSVGAFAAFASGGAGAYSATKGGISSLVRCMAVDYARHGIRVNAVVPGATETRLMWNNTDPADIDALRAQIGKEVPLGRLATPEEPARAVLWLLSAESSYVTGTQLICDGGILAKASLSV